MGGSVRDRVYPASQPPSATSTDPVMYEASGEHSHTAAAAISSGSAMRPSGTRVSSSPLTAEVMRVRVTPGAMALTRMPVPPSSSAAARVRPCTACLAATYALLSGIAAAPSIEEVLTMAPERWARMWRISARMHRQTPARSTWRTRMKSSSSYSSRGTYGPGTPALLCAASSLPKTPTARATASVTCPRFVTSATSISARGPSTRAASAVSARPSASMSRSATEAPAAAKAMALARPMPEAAPVISAARPVRSMAKAPPCNCPRLGFGGKRSSTVVVGEGSTQYGTGAVQQDPLVLGRDVQGGADFVGRHPADVAHGDHLALARRERGEGLVKLMQRFPGERHVLRGGVPAGRHVDGGPRQRMLATGAGEPVLRRRPFPRVQ